MSGRGIELDTEPLLLGKEKVDRGFGTIGTRTKQVRTDALAEAPKKCKRPVDIDHQDLSRSLMRQANSTQSGVTTRFKSTPRGDASPEEPLYAASS
jgi:hypothetical protein